MAQTKKNDSKDDAPIVADGAAAGPVISEPLVIPDMTFSPNADAAADDERHKAAEAEHLAHPEDTEKYLAFHRARAQVEANRHGKVMLLRVAREGDKYNAQVMGG